MIKPPYKAADLVTVSISESAANLLNGQNYGLFTVHEIIYHKPAPEPRIAYVYLAEDGNYSTLPDEYYYQAKIKVTWTPGSKEATAEVVEP